MRYLYLAKTINKFLLASTFCCVAMIANQALAQNSDIIEAGTLTFSTSIDPTTFVATDINGAGDDEVEVARFEIRDGGAGAPDVDVLSTELTDITLDITSGASNINKIAIYASAAEVVEATLGGGSITFNAISITAPDDGSIEFSVFVSFVTDGSVADNEVISVSINSTNVTANPIGTQFSAFGVVATSESGNENQIEVTADRLSFLSIPGSPVTNGVNFAANVAATDANINVDLDDNTTNVSISVNTGSGTLSSVTGINSQTLSGGVFAWSDLQLDAAGDHTLDISDDGTILTTGTSGTISIAPKITNVDWQDQNGNGNIDRVVIDFSDNVDVTDGSAADGLDVITISGVPSLDNADYATGHVNVTQVTLDFLGNEITGTDIAGLTLTYTPGSNLIASNTDAVEVVSGEVVANGGTYSDGAIPILLSVTAVDNTTLELQYSEDVTPTFTTPADWNATGITSSAAAQNVDNSIVDLTVNALNNTGFTASDFALTINNDASDQIIDGAGNNAANETGVTIIDGQVPVFQGATAVDDVTIQLQYSEDVVPTFTTPGDWTATGIISSAAAQNADNSIVDLTVNSLNNTAFTVADLALIINDDASDQIVDLAGNNAANISAQTINDGQLPVLLSVTAVDNNTLQLQYSENVTPSFTSPADWSATGITSSAAAQNADNSIVDLTVAALNNTGFTAADFALTINDDVNDQIIDDNSNLAANETGVTIVDGQAPVLVSVTAADNTTIHLLYSEDVVPTFSTPADWNATGITSSAAAQNANNAIVNLTVSALNNTAFTTSDFSLTINDDTSDQILDLAGNNASDEVGVNIVDGQEPVFLGATAVNNTTVQLQYSEDVVPNFTTPGDWIATGMTVSAATQNADNTIIDLTVNALNNTAYTASDLALSINADANDEILDLAGNNAPDISSQTITDGQDPVFQGAAAVDNTTIQLQYSEDVVPSFTTPGDWTATGITVSAAAQNADNSIVDLTVNALNNTAFTAADLALVINDDTND